ncbi:MAG: glutamine synthetase [Balneolaceae bacterium]|nr:glutamine synthetase [Balneolaceae bacterium]
MRKEEIITELKKSDQNFVTIAIADIDGVLRGKTISRKKFLKSLENHIGFCDVIFGWDTEDKSYEETSATGWHTGYPDGEISLDLKTFRKCSWNNDLPIVLADFSPSEKISGICPRTLLKKISEKAKEMGFSATYSCEFEWYNFQETPQSLAEKKGIDPTPMTPGMFGYSVLRASQKGEFYNDLLTHLPDFGIPLEVLHLETGDGVYEAAIEHADVLEAADRSVLFKTAVKEIASRHQITASFMAKWNVALPGSSGHIHQSLWDLDRNRNLFFDPSEENKMSRLMRQFIAGQLTCLPAILPMYAPTVNSYKRLVEGSWAPTSVSWGMDNRTTALRVINVDEDSMRLETRVPGADANPYLSMAASLASGLFGIENELALDLPVTRGSDYKRGNKHPLPKNLHEATERMKTSEFPSALFGDSFTDHFIKTREWEWKEFNGSVTDWEMKRYFEII